MADKADPNAKTIIYVGMVGVVLIFLVVILLQIVFYQTQEMETYRKVVSQAPEELEQLQAQQRGTMTGYGWVDEGNGVARIPIERAMELTVDELDERRAQALAAEEKARLEAFAADGQLLHLLGTTGDGSIDMSSVVQFEDDLEDTFEDVR